MNLQRTKGFRSRYKHTILNVHFSFILYILTSIDAECVKPLPVIYLTYVISMYGQIVWKLLPFYIRKNIDV